VADLTKRRRDGTGWEEQAGYSRAVRRLGHIAVSGTTANGPDGGALHPGDTYRQTLLALERGLAASRALGGGLADVVRTRIYLAPGASWEDAGRAHAEVLGSVAPANTMLYVAGLIGDGYMVEVELEALVPDEIPVGDDDGNQLDA
jgi:enamine deaminase RidA (YjgF/YER057c/UK114 family)